MSAYDEKSAPAEDVATHDAPTGINPMNEPVPRPAGWMYKGFRLGRHELWYASPKVQLFMVAMVCFLCPGMFNAISGLGAGGQLDATAADNGNVALYSTFSIVGFFSGTFANRLGIKLTMSIGGLGYCLYAGSLLSYSHNQNDGFVIAAGAILGVCAGLLWCAQGAILMSYPPERSKGRYISWFWAVFNMGAVIGALIPLGQNINKTTSGKVSDGTYIGFIILMVLGAVLALFLADATKIQREDGSKVIMMQNPSWKTEIMGLFDTLRHDPWIVLLFPMFFASNIFYTYQGTDMNAAHFNTRTRSLNNVLYWSAQIFGAVIFGYCLDISTLRRSVRAKAAFVALVVLTFAIWGGGWAWQKIQPTREEVEAKDSTIQPYDWTDGGKKYIGPMFLLIFYGFFDAAWQTSIYWWMGALSNSGRKAANLAGFYKGIQSAGAALFWRLDALKKPYNTMFGGSWGLLAGSLVFAAPIIFIRIKDTVTLEEDIKGTDETVEDVAGVNAIPEKAHHADV